MVDISVENVSKRYNIAEAKRPHESGLVAKLRDLRSHKTAFWAVKDLSFDVHSGEAVGIIGHNGAGKSTILKILSNITKPTSGRVCITGRLSSLIEVGSGFHPELTGRENVYLCGSILGMRRREIASKFESIVEFAEIPEFIDTPVKYYSSGMYVRLGFSIAAHLDPDILLLDEVLAVGDAAFQSKCIARVTELRDAGTTIVFISHDLGAVEKLCGRVILMNHGRVLSDGDPRTVIQQYQQAGFVASEPRLRTAQFNSKRVQITSVTFHDVKGSRVNTFSTGNPLTARVEFVASEDLPNAYVEIFLKSIDSELQCQLSTRFRNRQLDIVKGEGAIEFSVDELGLQPGLYSVDATVEQLGALEGVDWHVGCAAIQVIQGRVASGRFFMPHDWKLSGQSRTAQDEQRFTRDTER